MVARPTEFFSEHAHEVFGWLDGERKSPREALIEGAAGTGKTRTDLEFIYKYGLKFPGSKIVIVRDIRADMSETVLVEWEEFVLGPDHPSVRGGPQRKDRDTYTLPNGSQYIVRGFDRDSKLFSGQYHGGLFNEATELRSEEKWETLHRAMRAPLVHHGQFRFLMAECNPREEYHWLNERASAGRMMRIRTFLKDNPRWYDHFKRRWTQDGIEYIGNLSQGLTGPNRMRLLKGLWTNATGAVLPEFQKGVHVLNGTYDHATKLLTVEGWTAPVEIRWTFGAMDCGYEDSGVFGVWGVDRLGRMFELAEIYRSHWTHQDWVSHIMALKREFGIGLMVSDHDKALIEALNRAFMNERATPFARIADKTLGLAGTKGKDARIEIMRARLHRRELFFMANAPRFSDERLIALKRPWSTPMEIPRLRYEDYVYGQDAVKRASVIDGSTPDHGFDMTLYACSYAASRAVQIAPEMAKPVAGTAAAVFGLKPWQQRKRTA